MAAGPRRSGHSGGRTVRSKWSMQLSGSLAKPAVVDERGDESRPAGVERHDVAVAAARRRAGCCASVLRRLPSPYAGGVTGSMPPEKSSTGTSVGDRRRSRAGMVPRGHTSQTASAARASGAWAAPASARCSARGVDARGVLGARHRVVQRGVHLLGEVARYMRGLRREQRRRSRPRAASASISGSSARGLGHVRERLQRGEHHVEGHAHAPRARRCADRRGRPSRPDGPSDCSIRASVAATSGCARAHAGDARHAAKIASSARSRVRHTSSEIIERRAARRRRARALRTRSGCRRTYSSATRVP